MMKQFFLLLSLFFLSVVSFAATPLAIDDAFRLSAMVKDPQTIVVQWTMAPGYYLYRDRLHFSLVKAQKTKLSDPILPTGVQKHNELLGNYQAYSGTVNIGIPILKSQANTIHLKVNYQGCSEAGFCYPPTDRIITLNLQGPYLQNTLPTPIDLPTTTNNGIPTEKTISQILIQQNFFTMILSFIGFGLLIAFTPCVLPMVPIVSGIVVGQHSKGLKGLLLSASYVFGMALTYAIAGIIFGFLGSNIQTTLQTPLVITLFSLLFVLMALSLFGVYELKLPAFLQNQANKLSNQQKSGSFIGAFLMGILSTLILSPCVSPPLVGVLSYISSTGNAVLGGVALFSLGIGMGIPLLIIGALEAKYLPKAGTWMQTIKYLLGLLMLAVAIWMLSRILPGPLSLALWGLLLLGAAILLGLFSKTNLPTLGQYVSKIILAIFFIYGILLLINAAMKNSDPFKPFNFLSSQKETNEPQFILIKNKDTLENYLLNAKNNHKPILVDFYADWCIACKEMEKFTLENPDVKKSLNHFTLLKVDVTQNTEEDHALETAYGVIAPPTILFFNINGEEIQSARVVGNMNAQDFLQRLQEMK